MFSSISSAIFRAITPTSIVKKKKRKEESSTSNNTNTSNTNINSNNDSIMSTTRGRASKQYLSDSDGGMSNALAKRVSHISGFSSSEEEDDDEHVASLIKDTTNTAKNASKKKNEDESEDSKPSASSRPPSVAAGAVVAAADGGGGGDGNKTNSAVDLWKTLDKELRVNIGACVSCGICQSVMKDPVRTPCVHSFCKACIETSLRYHNTRCPLCKHTITKRGLTPLPKYIEELGDKYKFLLKEFGLIPSRYVKDFPLTQQTPAVVNHDDNGDNVDDDDVTNTKERCWDRYAVAKTWQSKAFPIVNPSNPQRDENEQVVETNLKEYEDAVRRDNIQNRGNHSIIMEENNDEKEEEKEGVPMSGGDDTTTIFATPAETESQRDLLSMTEAEQPKKPNAATDAATESDRAGTGSSSKPDKKQHRQLKKPPNLPLALGHSNRTLSSAKKKGCTEDEQEGRQENEVSSSDAKKPPPAPRKLVADPKDKNIEEEENNTKPKAVSRRSSFSADEQEDTSKQGKSAEEMDPFDTEVSPIAKRSSQVANLIHTPPHEEEKAKGRAAIHSPNDDITGLCEDTMGALHWTNHDDPPSEKHGLYQGTQDDEDDDERSKSLLEASSDRSRSLLEDSMDRSRSLLLEESSPMRPSSQHQADSSKDLSKSQHQDKISSADKTHASQVAETTPRSTTTKDHLPNKMMDNFSIPKNDAQKSARPSHQKDGLKTAEGEVVPPANTKAADPSISVVENQDQREQNGGGVGTGANVQDKDKEEKTEHRASKSCSKTRDKSNTMVYKDHSMQPSGDKKGSAKDQNSTGDNPEQQNSPQIGKDAHSASSSGADTTMANDGLNNNIEDVEDDDDMTVPIQDSFEPKDNGGVAVNSPALGIPATINENEKKRDDEPKRRSRSSSQHVTGRHSSRRKNRSRSREKNCSDGNNEFPLGKSVESMKKTEDAPEPRDATSSIHDDTVPPENATPSSSKLKVAEETPKENPTPKTNNLHEDRASSESKTTEEGMPTGERRKRRSRSSSRAGTATAGKPNNSSIDDLSPDGAVGVGRSVIQEVSKKPIAKRRFSGKTYSRRKASAGQTDSSQENASTVLDISENQKETAQYSKVRESCSELTKDATNTSDSPSAIERSNALVPTQVSKNDSSEPNEGVDEDEKKPAAKEQSSLSTSAVGRAKNTARRRDDATSIPADAMHQVEGSEEPRSKPAATGNSIAAAAASIPTNPTNSASKEKISASVDDANTTEWAVGAIVKVKSRTWSGVNKPGGVAKIVRINDDKTYNVRYVLGGRESNLDGSNLSPNEEPPKRRRADEDLPLALLKSLAADGFDTSGAGVSVAVAAKNGKEEAEKTKTTQRQQSSSKRRQKTIKKSAKKEPTSRGAGTTAASSTLQDNTNRKRDMPSGGTNNNRKKKTRSAPASTTNEKTDQTGKKENGSRALKRKGNSVQNKNKKAKATCSKNVKFQIPDLPNEEASKLADEQYQANFQAAIERGVVQVLASQLTESDISTLKSVAKIAAKDGVELKIVQTFNKNINVCVIPNHDRCPNAGLRTVKSLSCALAGVPITSPAWLQECGTEKKLTFPSSVFRTLATKTILVEQKNCNVSGVARLAANVHKYGKSALPLAGHEIYLCGGYKQEHRSDLSKLAKEAGAKLLLEPTDVSDRLQCGGKGHTTIVLVCYDSPKGRLIPSKLEKEIKYVVEQQSNALLVVESSWIIDSITCGKALEADAFSLKNPKANALWQLILDMKKAACDCS